MYFKMSGLLQIDFVILWFYLLQEYNHTHSWEEVLFTQFVFKPVK